MRKIYSIKRKRIWFVATHQVDLFFNMKPDLYLDRIPSELMGNASLQGFFDTCGFGQFLMRKVFGDMWSPRA
jgi:hypothetical protein